MTQITIRVWLTVFLFLGLARIASAQTYATALVTINGTQTGSANGTMTIAFNGHYHTIPYGQYSTVSSIASAFAAAFSSYPASAWPHLCTIGVCAKSSGNVISFQLNNGAYFQPFSITTTGTNSFSGTVTNVTTPTISTLTSSADPTQYGAALLLSASVTSVNSGTGNATPTGSVTFYDGATNLRSVTVNPLGVAPLAISTLNLGTHSITASYSGDNNYLPSTSAVLSEVVATFPPSISVATSTTPTNYGTAVTFTAIISNGPVGNIIFQDGGQSIGEGTIVSNTANLTTSSLAAGTHNITAYWPGSTNYPSATSSSITQTVLSAAPPNCSLQ